MERVTTAHTTNSPIPTTTPNANLKNVEQTNTSQEMEIAKNVPNIRFSIHMTMLSASDLLVAKSRFCLGKAYVLTVRNMSCLQLINIGANVLHVRRCSS